MSIFNKNGNIQNEYDAIAEINGSSSHNLIKGIIYLSSYQNGVLLSGEINNLPSKSTCGSKVFAFHIHEGASCTGNNEDEFANAGMHYNPHNCLHPFHVGDLPPIFENNGYAYFSFFTNKFSINDVIGRTIIIHSNPDDFNTQPSGNAGEKIACGLFRRK